MVSSFNKKIITLKSFTSYASAKYDLLATTYRSLAVDFRPKPNFLILKTTYIPDIRVTQGYQIG